MVAAIAAGGGPHTFACGGPTTVVTSGEIALAQTVELDGGGLLTLSGAGTHRVFSVPVSTPFLLITVTLRNLSLRDGVTTTDSGGCIAAESPLTLDHVSISGCHADIAGGGISASTDLTITNSSIVENTAAIRGGGISASNSFSVLSITGSRIEGNQATFEGGGIFSGANTTITDSTIRRNRAQSAGGISFYYAVTASITRSTISNNKATATLAGGGIHSFATVVTLTNSTLALNPPVAIRTNGFPPLPGPTPDYLILDHSTIVAAAGSAPSAIFQAQLEDLYSHVRLRHSVIRGICNTFGYSDGVNVESPGHSCTAFAPNDLHDVPQSALQLGKLGDHGGPTQTVPLLPGSVAIDAATGCPPPATDQRGIARPLGAGCDVGAFEQDFTEVVPALPPAGVAALAAALLALGRRRARRADYCSKQ